MQFLSKQGSVAGFYRPEIAVLHRPISWNSLRSSEEPWGFDDQLGSKLRVHFPSDEANLLFALTVIENAFTVPFLDVGAG